MDNKIWDLRFSKHGDGTGNAKTRSDSDVLSYLLQGARAHFKLGLGHLYVSISLYRRGLHQIPVSTLGALIVLIGAPAFWQHLRHRAGFFSLEAERRLRRLAPLGPGPLLLPSRRPEEDRWRDGRDLRDAAQMRRASTLRDAANRHMLTCCENCFRMQSHSLFLKMEPHLSMKRASGLSPTKNAGHVLFCFCAVARFCCM